MGREIPGSQLRILHVTPYAEAAWGYGGIPRVVGALTRGLAARGHRVSVVATDAADAGSRLVDSAPVHSPPVHSPPVHLPQKPDVDVHLFPNLSNTLAYHLQFFLPRGMSSFLARHAADFDLAHLHACHNLPGVLAARHLRRAGVPYLLTPHGTAPRIERRRLAKWLFDQTLGRRVLPGAARVTAVSQAEVKQLRQLGVAEDRIGLLPNPVEQPPAELDPEGFRKRWGLAEDALLVLYLGKLTPRKQVELLVDAFAPLGMTGSGITEARLVIAGNDMGSGASVRRRIRRQGLEEHTVMTGLLRGPERFDALAAADVVVYPSRDEIFGLVPFEALLCATPVVVADDSGCGELVTATGGGRVVPLGDVEALTAAIADTLADREGGRSAVEKAATEVRARWTARPVCRDLERLYEVVMNEVVMRS